ncbi:hypothetical protein VitviT2T_019541 [Vitis vinifera]|uniref:Lysosomal Pro-X carboxypeptidase n=2 Tax=Vitis vinifera TaxID=29760 RepID=A0ABY9D152_VITVI|eukprot:XP_002270231.1 PREDICTED: lysosomal Pro-X carboxypeptidase [Vitis vinifera]
MGTRAVSWLPWLILLFITASVSATPSKKIPRLGVLRGSSLSVLEGSSSLRTVSVNLSENFQTFFYPQTLDHFNYRPESYTTFQHRYMVNFNYWGGARSAAQIFVYLGEESDLDKDINSIGFLVDNGARFGALLVYIEHRYYGKSNPFGSMQKSLQNASRRGYFNSGQALADYAEVIINLKKNLSADSSPVIVVGGSYGGLLAAWFRLKYPHVALGALASSAPILYFDDITPQDGYYSLVTKDFRDFSESCYNTIKDSWAEIDKAAAEANGLLNLSKKFRTCKPLESASQLKDYLETMYSIAAQYDRPPMYPVTVVCNGIDGGLQGTDILDRIFSGIVASRGNKSCYDMGQSSFPSETEEGWNWQVCSELVIPIGRGSNDTMFPAAPFDFKEYADSCKYSYGVTPRPHWITSYYGGHNIKLILKRFGSNIIFSNGLRDPYSSGGVLEDISHSIIAVHTPRGSHCLDILPSTEDDPNWLVLQRNVEIEIIHGWLLKYYEDLLQSN